MDWMAALTGNCFIEENTLRNTKAHKFAVGRLFIDVFDTTRLLEMYAATAQGIHVYRHVNGGDQQSNAGMLLDWENRQSQQSHFGWNYANTASGQLPNVEKFYRIMQFYLNLSIGRYISIVINTCKRCLPREE